MKPTKKLARRKARRVGIESVAEARKLQHDVLRRLKQSKANGFAIASLKQCSPEQCGGDRCREVCAFGALRQRTTSIAAACNLLETHEGPLFEVRVSRAAWCRPLGELQKVSLTAATKLIRRALDSLYNPNVIAVGSLKMTVVAGTMSLWRPEVHLLVAGTTREELYQALSSSRTGLENFLLIDEITDVKEDTTRVLTHGLHVWQHPSCCNASLRPKKSIRAEYYSWSLPITSGGLTFRYGCDRRFNKLNKDARTIKPPKPRKQRRDPVWLERWQFGTESRECMELEKERRRERI